MTGTLFAALAPASTAAETQAPASNLAPLASMLGGLILVLLLIFVLAYLLRRLNLVPGSGSLMKTLAVTPLGQKEKLVLVDVGGEQYLLGVTPSSVNLIEKLASPLDIPQDNTFAARLKQAKAKQA
ncbi:flagellar biosynthetic protein FliO [Shewanella cyperi]